MWLLYYSGIYLLVLAIRIASLWNPKAKLWIAGRDGWKQKIKTVPRKENFRIWFHVASLGEFEQARPVIERIKEKRPSTEIILTFFSPSGYEIRKNYPMAHVYYIPADLPGNAGLWLKTIQPDQVVFVKYDLWPGYLRAGDQLKIPTILIAATFRRGLSSWSFPLTRKYLKQFKMIFLQRKDASGLLKEKGFKNIEVAGDPRVDRVASLPIEANSNRPEILKELGKFDLVAGSTWKEDEEVVLPVVHQLKLKTLIAPHDVSPQNLKRVAESITVPFTWLSKSVGPPETDIIVVDSIGLLSSLYALGKVAYVGGGFSKGIHNTLEPIAHGKAVIFGPRYSIFPEATESIEKGFGFSIHSSNDLRLQLEHLLHDEELLEKRKLALVYIEHYKGATDVISDYLLNSIPFSERT